MTFVEMIDKWLEAKRISLWADFEIQRPDRRRTAAEWFAREMTDFLTSDDPQ